MSRAKRLGAVFVGVVVIALTARWCVTRDDAAKKTEAKQAAARPILVERNGKRTPSLPRTPKSSALTHTSNPDRKSSWGGGPDQLGRDRPSEGSASGPMSFTVGPGGAMYVLDQVNQRVVKIDAEGKRKTLPIASPTAQDLAIGEDGAMAVLDRFKGQDVAIFDDQGNPLGSIPLVGEGVENPGLVTGVFVDGTDVYVEKEHATLTKIGSTDGTAAEPRTDIPGRPTRDGKAYIKAGIIDADAGRTYVAANARPGEEHLYTREINLDAPILAIQLLDTDQLGQIYFATQVQEDGEDVIVLVCLDQMTGAPQGSAILPANTLPEESFRDLVVLDTGGVMMSIRSEDGVSYQFYDCDD